MSIEFDGFLSSGGNVYPSRFVSIVSGNRGYVQQGTASTPVIGVSCEGTFYPPGTAADLGYAGVDTLPFRVYAPGRSCLIRLGGTVSAGDRLVSDASGQATTMNVAATTHQYVGGIALDSGISGGLIRMFVWPFDARPA
jgi:hypothetical protein